MISSRNVNGCVNVEFDEQVKEMKHIRGELLATRLPEM